VTATFVCVHTEVYLAVWRRLELARGGCDSTHLDAVARAHDRMDAPTDDLPTPARSGNQVSDTKPVDLAAPVEDSRRNVETVDGTVRTGIDRVIEADHSRPGQLPETPFHDAVEHGGETVTAVASGSSPVYGWVRTTTRPDVTSPSTRWATASTWSTTGRASRTRSTTARRRRGGRSHQVRESIVTQAVDVHGRAVPVTGGRVGGARFGITAWSSRPDRHVPGVTALAWSTPVPPAARVRPRDDGTARPRRVRSPVPGRSGRGVDRSHRESGPHGRGRPLPASPGDPLDCPADRVDAPVSSRRSCVYGVLAPARVTAVGPGSSLPVAMRAGLARATANRQRTVVRLPMGALVVALRALGADPAPAGGSDGATTPGP